MKFYHAACTGPNLEILKSFVQVGIKTELATGHGQGKGFFVWTNRELAVKHALEFLSDFKKGYPLIITVEADVNPIDWDLDYEVHKNEILKFLYDNFELLKQIPDRAVIIDDQPLIVSRCRLNPKFQTITFAIGTKVMSIGFSEGMIRDAAIVGPIFDYMQVKFPAETAKFETAIMKQELRALKYVGKSPPKIVGYDVLVDGKWINGLTLLEK